MKIKLILISFYLLVITTAFSKNKCYIIANVGDCSTCFLEINEIDKISKSLDPELIFPESYRNDTEELKDLFPILNSGKVSYSFNDAIHRKYAQPFSSVVVIDDKGNIVCNIAIKGFLKYLNDINIFSDENAAIT